ncbi:MAG: hypothetical protein ACK5M7_00655 [Draconibacterium sp.]
MEFLLSTGDLYFSSLAFDNEGNIWLYGNNNGIAFWNKSTLTVYNTDNSQLPTNAVHGIGVDKHGTVWVSLDYKGLLKILNNNWIITPNSEIPGLLEESYLRGPKIDPDNNLWFEVFHPDTSNILRLDNGNWKYEFPDNTVYSNLFLDSKGTIWSINRHFDVNVLKYATLKYFHKNSWINFDIGDITGRIFILNADENTVYIGTEHGLIEKPR